MRRKTLLGRRPSRTSLCNENDKFEAIKFGRQYIQSHWTKEERRALADEAQALFGWSGSYGCTYKPPGLMCPNNDAHNARFRNTDPRRGPRYVTKVMTADVAHKELLIAQQLETIDPQQDRFLYLLPDSACTTLLPEQWQTTCTNVRSVRKTKQQGVGSVVAYRIRYGGIGYGSFLMKALRAPLAADELRWLWLYLLRQIQWLFASLQVLHDRGIVHLDVTISNVVIDDTVRLVEGCWPKLIDFGLSLSFLDNEIQQRVQRFLGKYYSRYPMEMNALASITSDVSLAVDSTRLYEWMMSVWIGSPTKRFLWIPSYRKWVANANQWKALNECLKTSSVTAAAAANTTAAVHTNVELRPYGWEADKSGSAHPCVSRYLTVTQARASYTISPVQKLIERYRHEWAQIMQNSKVAWSTSEAARVRLFLTGTDTYLLAQVAWQIWDQLEKRLAAAHLSALTHHSIQDVRDILSQCMHPDVEQRLTPAKVIQRFQQLRLQAEQQLGTPSYAHFIMQQIHDRIIQPAPSSPPS